MPAEAHPVVINGIPASLVAVMDEPGGTVTIEDFRRWCDATSIEERCELVRSDMMLNGDLLTLMVTSDVRAVRVAMASRSRLGYMAIDTLANSHDHDVQMAMARSGAGGWNSLWRMSREQVWTDVDDMAIETRNRMESLAADLFDACGTDRFQEAWEAMMPDRFDAIETVSRAASADWPVPEWLERQIIEDGDDRQMHVMAQTPPGAISQELVAEMVRLDPKSVSHRTDLPEELLDTVMHDCVTEARVNVGTHLQAFLENPLVSARRAETVWRMMRSIQDRYGKLTAARAFLVAPGKAPNEVIALLARHELDDYRANPCSSRLDTALLESLARDLVSYGVHRDNVHAHLWLVDQQDVWPLATASPWGDHEQDKVLPFKADAEHVTLALAMHPNP